MADDDVAAANSETPRRWSAAELFASDEHGRSPLFAAAAAGRLADVEAMLASLPGTGIFPQRLAFIELKDDGGLTAADLAAQHGQDQVAELLRYHAWMMEHFG